MGKRVPERLTSSPQRALWWTLVDRREWPIHDGREPEIDALSLDQRASRACFWEWRAGAALSAALSDDFGVGDLLSLGLGGHVITVATRIASDRVREASLCRELARRHRRSDGERWPVVPPPLVASDDPLMKLAAVCLVDASITSACLVDALSERPGKLVAAVLRDIAEARVAQVRAGWDLLDHFATDRRAGERFAEQLPALIAWGLERIARETPTVGPCAEPGSGILSTRRRLAIARETLHDILLPRVQVLAMALDMPLFDLMRGVHLEVA